MHSDGVKEDYLEPENNDIFLFGSLSFVMTYALFPEFAPPVGSQFFKFLPKIIQLRGNAKVIDIVDFVLGRSRCR